MNGVLVLLILLAVIYLCRKPFELGGWLWMLGAIVGYGVGLYILERPEERVHFFQYGVLAFLIFRALDHFKGRFRFAATVVLATFIGWVDEVIQYFLPTRYYDNRDVVLNAASAVLALMIVKALSRKPSSV